MYQGGDCKYCKSSLELNFRHSGSLSYIDTEYNIQKEKWDKTFILLSIGSSDIPSVLPSIA